MFDVVFYCLMDFKDFGWSHISSFLFVYQVECAKYDRNTQQFFDRYRINIGEDSLPIIVSSLDLYRLHRVIERKPRVRDLSVSSQAR